MIFRQLIESVSSTYLYVLGCPETSQAILIDPIVNSMDRDLRLISRVPWQPHRTFRC